MKCLIPFLAFNPAKWKTGILYLATTLWESILETNWCRRGYGDPTWLVTGISLIHCIPVTLQCWIWPSSTCRESPRCQLGTSLWTSSNRSGRWSCSSSPERAAWSWLSPQQTLTWPTPTPLNWRRTSTRRVRQGNRGCGRNVELETEANETLCRGVCLWDAVCCLCASISLNVEESFPCRDQSGVTVLLESGVLKE